MTSADTHDLLSSGDRLCLETARARGNLEAAIWQGGREIPDEIALRDHFDAMAEEHLLIRTGQYGSKRGRLVVTWEPTPAGLKLLEAVERIEHA